MQCDRAQEFFSEYLERTLDRPMTVALESHLAACGGCRDEIEGLRDLFVAMEAVPEVEPPRDGAWRVIRALQEERAKEVEAARPRTHGFFDWLRSLSPGSAAMGAGLATLVIGGTLAATGIPHVQWNFFPVRGPQVVHSGPTQLAPASLDAPAVQVSMGGLTNAGHLVRLRLVPQTELIAPQVQLSNGYMKYSYSEKRNLGPETAWEFPVNLAAGTTSEALQMTVLSNGKTYEYLVVVPLANQQGQTVTLSLVDQPLVAGLRQLVPYLGKAIVVDGAVQGNVQLQIAEQQPRVCLEEMARRVGAAVRIENGVYRLVAAR